jgi:8-oxo-dGTP diphosphatase
MDRRLHRGLLAVFRRLPRRVRQATIRVIAPNFTVGAVSLVEHDGRLLLVQLAYRSRWGAPGGLLNPGEDAEAAARREVREEVGVGIETLGPPEVVVDPESRRVDIVFRARLAAGVDPAAARAVSAEITEAAWFDLDHLPALQAETAGALVAIGRRDAR